MPCKVLGKVLEKIKEVPVEEINALDVIVDAVKRNDDFIIVFRFVFTKIEYSQMPFTFSQGL